MKGDFSKDTFRKKKHFHDVRMQQGRVMLDTDWNEQADITSHRIEIGTIDIIGKTGAPLHYAGFEMIPVDNSGNPASPGTNIKIKEGRFYVDGILCEHEASCLFIDQPDFDKTALPVVPGKYVFYLDVWQRHISALEDNDIREVALGGPDTTTRSKTVWQVKFVLGTNTSTCLDPLPASIVSASTGLLKARAELPVGSSDPCGLTSGGGYSRLENQLYRVEIHKGGNTRATSTFKWSRDNGSIEVKWESIDAANPNNLVVSNTGRDEILGFKSGDWVELIDDKSDLLGLAGIMVQLTKVEGNVLTINPGGNTISLSLKNPRIRRWDHAGAEINLNTNNTSWIALEDGVEVNFKEGTYKTGDFWLIPARTATANIEWPKDNSNNPLELPPQGIHHHFAKLGILELGTVGGALKWTSISDCRHLFPPLTELISLHYVGGDGQEAMPKQPLPNTFKVGVANGQWMLPGAKVKFEVMDGGNGILSPASGMVVTDANGIAECQLILGDVLPSMKSSVQVKARLLDAAGNIAPDHLPVIFGANFSLADTVFYQSKCDHWSGTKPDTVAKALDELCERESNAGCSFTIGPNGDFKTLDEALRKLAEKDASISLCFMPGEHTIEEDIIMTKKESKLKIIKITGYAATIKMKAKRLELMADKIVLFGLTVTANLENKEEDETEIALSANETIMEYCAWSKAGTSKSPFVNIQKEGLVYLKNNIFLGWFSLVLANGVQGIVEGNIISYLLLQNQKKETFEPAPLLWLNNEMKKKIADDLIKKRNEEIKLTDWSLTIRGNRVGFIITNVNRTKPHDLYQNMYVSENTFQFQLNSFAAKFLNMVNNQFLFEDPAGKVTVLAYVVGFNVIVMGNSCASVKLRSTIPKSVGIIDAIVLNMIKGQGSGAAQILNLVDVVV